MDNMKFFLVALLVVSLVLVSGCASNYNPPANVAVTLPHSNESVVLNLKGYTVDCNIYWKDGAERVEYKICGNRGGGYELVNFTNGSMEYELMTTSTSPPSTSARYVCKTEPCEFAPTEEKFARDYFNPAKWMDRHIAIVCFKNGTYLGIGSSYPSKNIGSVAFGYPESEGGVYSYPNELLFKSPYGMGADGFNAALVAYNRANNASENISLTQKEAQDLSSGTSITRFPYEVYSFPNRNGSVYLLALKAKLWVERGDGCPSLMRIG
ncbi:MAG: hypothetical protein WCT52_05085 [Candidatus Micrarchaeia archaeon]